MFETENKVMHVPDYRPSQFILCETNCLASSGFMFNVKLNQGSDNIVISTIQFDHLKGSANSSVDVYTTLSGTLAGKQEIALGATAMLAKASSNCRRFRGFCGNYCAIPRVACLHSTTSCLRGWV